VALYPWKRFWAGYGGPMTLSPEGFLADPEIQPFLENVFAFEQISGLGPLILMGEPAIGKSTAVEAVCREAREILTHPDIAVWKDLRKLLPWDLRVEFLADPEIQRWMSSKVGILHLFVDSLDEMLRVDGGIGTRLVNLISGLDLGRLNLHLVCRTADWPHSLDREIEDCFGVPPFKYELLLLRRCDIELAAEQEGIDPKAFVDEVSSRGVVGLATKPGTLAMWNAPGLTEAPFLGFSRILEEGVPAP